MVVDHTDVECFFDNRSEELNSLVNIYDSRPVPFIASATATVFERPLKRVEKDGLILVARYNVERTPAEIYAPLFSKSGIKLGPEFKFNFDWIPFDLKGFVFAHAPLSDAFKRKHGFRFEIALLILMVLCYEMLFVWLKEPLYMIDGFQRGYTGPSRLANVKTIITKGVDHCAEILGIEPPLESELDPAIRFLTLTPEKKKLVSLPTGGPTFVFLPSGGDTVIIDFVWVTPGLQYLFFGVPLRDKGTKGKLLESLVSRNRSVLPDGECKGPDGTSREFDAAFQIGKVLLIVECKANARSIAYDRGDLSALKYRRRAFEEALEQVDEKAKWLTTHVKGTNYNISKIEAILPVVVTPFREFMPSLADRYWIRPELPRVLIPQELEEFLGTQCRDCHSEIPFFTLYSSPDRCLASEAQLSEPLSIRRSMSY